MQRRAALVELRRRFDKGGATFTRLLETGVKGLDATGRFRGVDSSNPLFAWRSPITVDSGGPDTFHTHTVLFHAAGGLESP
jgi:hypothetical protein